MGDRIVRERECREISGLSRTTRYQLERRVDPATGDPLFPRRVVLTGGRCGWRLSALQKWIASRQERSA